MSGLGGHSPREPLVRIIAAGGRLRVESVRPSATTLVERTVGAITWAPLILHDETRQSVILNLPPREAELLGGLVRDAAADALGLGRTPSPDDPPTSPETTPE